MQIVAWSILMGQDLFSSEQTLSAFTVKSKTVTYFERKRCYVLNNLFPLSFLFGRCLTACCLFQYFVPPRKREEQRAVERFYLSLYNISDAMNQARIRQIIHPKARFSAYKNVDYTIFFCKVKQF